MVAAAANDPGERGGSRAGQWVLAPPSCGDQLPARVPRAAPRRSSLRFPLSLPGSFASLAMGAPTASCAPARPLPAIGLGHPGWPRRPAAPGWAPPPQVFPPPPSWPPPPPAAPPAPPAAWVACPVPALPPGLAPFALLVSPAPLFGPRGALPALGAQPSGRAAGG